MHSQSVGWLAAIPAGPVLGLLVLARLAGVADPPAARLAVLPDLATHAAELVEPLLATLVAQRALREAQGDRALPRLLSRSKYILSHEHHSGAILSPSRCHGNRPR